MTHAKALLTVALLMAGAALVLLNPPLAVGWSDLLAVRSNMEIGALILAGLVIAGLIAFFIGFLPNSRRISAEQLPLKNLEEIESPTAPLELAMPPATADASTRRDVEESKALIAFAQELLGVTSHARARDVITRHLPPMVGSRRVWVSTRVQGRRQIIVAEGPHNPVRELLKISGHDWTTFPLRAEQESIGLLGVESEGGLEPHVKQVVRVVAPLIAQALNTVGHIEVLREASLVDLLTGAATRREGLTRLGAEIKRAQRTGSSMAILMLDLDCFKSINDRFGHAVGDAVLTEVGRTLQRTLRASDSRCRWGGEEFLIVLPDTDLTRAQVVANGLLRSVPAATVATPSGPVGTTVSIGITITRPGETQIEPIVRRADIALYRAKEAGRSCFRIVLGDRSGNPIGVPQEPKPPPPPRSNRTLPFPDRRNPLRRDRRTVPSPGRRSTDPRPQSREERPATALADDRRVQTSLH
jgi:diguanylate cyclase (GGDEF)-like protein